MRDFTKKDYVDIYNLIQTSRVQGREVERVLQLKIMLERKIREMSTQEKTPDAVRSNGKAVEKEVVQ